VAFSYNVTSVGVTLIMPGTVVRVYAKVNTEYMYLSPLSMAGSLLYLLYGLFK
jgi:hypothetical protein